MVCANIGLTLLSILIVITVFFDTTWARWVGFAAAILILIIAWTGVQCRCTQTVAVQEVAAVAPTPRRAPAKKRVPAKKARKKAKKKSKKKSKKK